MIRHVCPGCDAALWSSPRAAGLPIRCTSCRFEVTVPYDSSDELPARYRSVRRPAPRRSASWVFPVAAGIAVLFGAACLTGVVAYAAHRMNVNPADEPLTRAVRARDGRSQLRVPASWIDQPLDFLEEGELKVGTWRDDMCVKVLTEPKVILGQTMNRDEYARLVTDNMKGKLLGASVGGPQTVTVEGRPAVRYELTGRAAGVSALFLVTVVEGEAHFHQIIAVSTSAAAARNRPLLEKITQSFREAR